MIKLFNYVWIGITAFFIFLTSRFFFLGTEDDFNFLKTDLILNILGRTFLFASIGLIPMLLLLLINYLKTKNIKNSLKIGVFGLLICLLSSLIGTLFFFNL